MLDDARKDKLMELFAEGVELDPAERAAFVERACGDDPELREELRTMLAVEATELQGFLVEPVTAPVAPAAATTARPPDIRGHTDFEPIGEGGMGMVYRAQQVAPVRRVVAIKMIRPGMDSRQVLARFEVERQALARMAHPCIANVHDAGTDAHGRPYLSMEFVDGVPITEYRRKHDLGLVPLLELFAKVCDAVDHAHRRGVLHRDLKPSNVLVVHTDDGPQPKVIDFGIAKALEGSLGDDSVHTLDGTLLGTPEYMSPERLDGDSRTADTRTDVYALGAMLYELLCGERPFDSQRLRAAGLTGLARIVRDEVPPRPSTRLRGRSEPTTQNLGTLHWTRQLHLDLDWVALKALEKDPEHRYPTPRDLAEDLRRFLRHEPIEAGPPSGFYRMRKFARRYRIQLAAAAAVIVALVVGLLGTLWFLFESKDNEARALANAREATGTRLAATAALIAEENPNLALLLAVEAGELSDDFSVNETILGALQRQNLVGRFQHADYGTTKAVFLDDGRLLSCGVDPVFWLTDVDAQVLVRRFVGHSGRVFDMALSPSRHFVASASADGTARVWDLATGDCLQVLRHPGAVLQVAWSPDGTSVWTRCANGTVQGFAARSGELQRTLGDDLRWLAVDDDSARVVTVNAAGDAALWSATGERLLTVPFVPRRDAKPAELRVEIESSEITFVAGGTRLLRFDSWLDGDPRTLLYTVDGTLLGELGAASPIRAFDDRLLLSSGGGAAVMSLATGEVVERGPIEGLNRLLAVADDGRRAIGIDHQADVCVVDLEHNRITGGLSGENDKNRINRHVAFHADGARFVITGRELLMCRFEAEYAPFDLPLDERDSVASMAAAGEALALVRHEDVDGARWSLWSIDQQRRVRDLPIERLDQLQLVTDGTELQGLRVLPTTPGAQAQAEVLTFDLDGTPKTKVALPFRDVVGALRPEGGRYIFVEARGERCIAHEFDSRTGTPLSTFEFDSSWTVWGSGPDARFLATLFGSRTRTDAFDLRTGRRVASLSGPTGAGHYGVSIDEPRERMLVVLGDLRARSYELGRVDAGPTGEYTRLVRSNEYPCGFLPDGSMAWVRCSNEVHLFDAVTCRPFAALRLRDGVRFAAARGDSSELVSVTRDGRCQRWPLDTLGSARRLARGALTQRERDLYRIGAPAERIEHEERRLAANPTSRNLAMLGESRLGRGDLDGAIDAYRRCCETGPLAPMDLRRYLRLLELLARRHPAADRTTAARTDDLTLATAALREAVRCGVTRAALDALPGFDALAQHDDVRRLLPH